MNQEFVQQMRRKCRAIYDEAARALERGEVKRYPTIACIVAEGHRDSFINLGFSPVAVMADVLGLAAEFGASALFLVAEAWIKMKEDSDLTEEQMRELLKESDHDISKLPGASKALVCVMRLIDDDGYWIVGKVERDEAERTNITLIGEFDKSAGDVPYPITAWGA
jgi:predicted DNA-binding protein (MmcQ/YjbR family)